MRKGNTKKKGDEMWRGGEGNKEIWRFGDKEGGGEEVKASVK